MLNGNIFGKVNASTASAASGVWSLREQSLSKFGGTWPGSNSPISYVSSGYTRGAASQTWSFTPGASTCVVVGLTALAFIGAGSPTLTTRTFNGTALTIVRDRYLTNYEPDGTTPAVYSWLLGIVGNFSGGTSYPIVINVTGMTSGGDISATALSFNGPVTGFANASSSGGTGAPSSTTAASVTITPSQKTSIIGYGARQANSPLLSGGEVRVVTPNDGNTRSHMSQVDNATSQTFTTTGGAVGGFALTW